MSAPMSPERLTELRAEYASTGRIVSGGAVDLLAAVSILLDELAAARALAADATEYRVLLPDLGGKELRVSRQYAGFGAGWAVVVPRYGGGVAWTREGWQEAISALSVDRLFCWPDAPSAIREGRAALAADDETGGAR